MGTLAFMCHRRMFIHKSKNYLSNFENLKKKNRFNPAIKIANISTFSQIGILEIMEKEVDIIQANNFVKTSYLENCNAMLKYAVDKGMEVPVAVVMTIDQFNKKEKNTDETTLKHESLNQLVSAHNRLSKIVAPATPRSIRFIHVDESNKSPFSFISPIKFLRQMLGASMLSLIALILLAMLCNVSFNSTGEVFKYYGLDMLANLTFFIAAAGLGASFAALFEANEYIEDGTFDPKYKSTYWIRFSLGLVSGMLLASLIPTEWLGEDLELLARPTLAMLGGFSASLVYRILRKFVETIEIFFGRKTKELREITTEKSKVMTDFQELKAKYIRQITELNNTINSVEVPEEVKSKIEKIVNEVIPPDTLPENENGNLNGHNFEFEYSEDEEKYRIYEYEIEETDKKEDR